MHYKRGRLPITAEADSVSTEPLRAFFDLNAVHFYATSPATSNGSERDADSCVIK